MISLIDFLKKENPNMSELKNVKDISAEDIFELANIYNEVLSLECKYKNTTLGKKEIAEEIKRKTELLERVLFYFKAKLKAINDEYMYKEEYINDYEKAIRIIIRLANSKGGNYASTTLNVADEMSFEVARGERKREYTEGKVLIVSEKDIIDNLDNSRIYRAHEVGFISNKLLSHAKSLIIVTDYCYDSLVKPNIFNQNPRLGTKRLEADNTNGHISCYFCDLNLLEAVKSFIGFINEYGADIKDIPEEEIYKLCLDKPLTRTKKI